MKNKRCNKCKKMFTREWNLQRHLKSIHHISDYSKNNLVKQNYGRHTYSDPSPIKIDHASHPENKISELKPYPNPSIYHNIENRYYSDIDYNNGFYLNYELLPIEKKEPKLTIQDGIRIQRAFIILKNILLQFYPYNHVVNLLYWVNRQCNTKQSDQPLKDIFIKYNLSHFWPSK